MKVTSFEQACEVNGYDPAKVLPDVSGVPARHQSAVVDFVKLVIITEAINYDEETKEQWEPDWNDSNQWKWRPWFVLKKDKRNNPSGFRFDASGCGISKSNTTGGSRLCYKSEDDSDYAGQQFIDLFRSVMTLPK